MSKRTHTPASAAAGIEQAIRRFDGRWKLVILFHLFGGKTLRFSDLERAIPDISQKMLTQQLRQLERDGIVSRTVHAEVPPKVEYHLTTWGQSLCPALDQLLTWAEQQPAAGVIDKSGLGGVDRQAILGTPDRRTPTIRRLRG
jgi:DNA-binding HxlR family transcriptional regulator